MVIPCTKRAADTLLSNPIYQHLSGHAVLSYPPEVLEVLAMVNCIGELHRGAWALAAEKTGLTSFWRYVNASAASLDRCDEPAAKENMNLAIREIIENGALKRLLPHLEVVRKSESLRNRLEDSIPHTKDQILGILNDLCTMMSDYKL